MVVFGETNGEKVVCVLMAVLSWLIIARELRRRKLNFVATAVIVGCMVVFLYVEYIALKVKGY
jgi:hypothetical protein